MSLQNPIQPRGGELLGRYELLLPIAKGGMAEVWLARLSGTRGFRKIVAIKTILRGAIDDARMEQMFIEEATLASQIHHPNTVEVLDFGEHDGTLFIAMEWVEGEPLNVIVAEARKRGGLPLAIAVNVLGQACKGLHAAHELRDDAGSPLGIVHRDISPQNLIVSYSGTVKVLDFGIAKATAQVSTLTEAGEVKGKFAYMSPEQVSGGELDRRSDIFSLAVLGYMLTTGRHPFRGENSAETVKKIFSPEPAPPPSSFIPDFPSALEAALLRALAKRPEDRFQTAHEFLAALEDVAPEHLENSFEVTLGTYMRDLLGTRRDDLRRRLRLAEENSGREGSGVMIAPTSQGSLGAVSIDGGRGTGSSISARLPMMSEPTTGSIATGALPAPRRRIGYAVLPLASAALVAAGFFLSRQMGTSSTTVPTVAVTPSAPKGVPNAVAGSGASTPNAPTPSAPSAARVDDALPPSASAGSVPLREAPDKAAADPRGARGRRVVAHTQARATDGTKSAGSASAASAGTATSSAAPVVAPAAPSPSNNSWDRSTFGGRY